MKHFAIFIADLESERFLSASNDQISTWLFLHALCSKTLNSGTINDADVISERYWSRHGINSVTIKEPSPLWSWDAGNLSVEPYDYEGQSLYSTKVAAGIKGAEKRWNGTPNGSANGNANGNANAPNLTLPNLTLPDITIEEPSSDGDETFLLNNQTSKRKTNPDVIFDYWNSKPELPKIRNITPNRRKHLDAQMKDDFFRENWATGIDKIAASPFATGANDRQWKADIDWLLKAGNLVKVVEGKYDRTARVSIKDSFTSADAGLGRNFTSAEVGLGRNFSSAEVGI